MRVLLDECVDPKAGQFFSDSFQVKHVKDVGWLGTKNGELVRLASGSFDVLFTIDGNMRHQTSLKGLSLVVFVAEGHFKSVEDYRSKVQQFKGQVSSCSQGEFHLLAD